MTTPVTQWFRCPCCGDVFNLADAEPVSQPASASLTKPVEEIPEQQPPAPAGQQPGDKAIALPIKLVFDGGSIGNPGRGYGSYQLTVRGKAEQPKRIELGEGYTNNEAEYDTLAAALEAVLGRARDPRRVDLDIRGDSQLVINQINGVWKAKEPRMRRRLEHIRGLLDRFGRWKATWHDRGKSVKALGH